MNTSKLHPKEKLTLETMTLEELRQFPTANAMLDELYGKEGTPSREAFNREADEYYYQTIAEMEAEEEEKSINKQEELVTN